MRASRNALYARAMLTLGGLFEACQTCESPLVVSSDNSACNVPPSIKARRARRDAQMRATSRGEMSDPAPQPFRRKKRFDTWA